MIIFKRPKNIIPRYIRKRLLIDNKNFLALFAGEAGCQPKGSKVLMADGEWKNIEDIKDGDLVLSPQKGGSHIYAKVLCTTKWFSNQNYNVYELNRNKRKLYSCSYNHLIPVFHRVHPRRNKKRLSKWAYWAIEDYTATVFARMSRKRKNNQNIGISCFSIDKFKDRDNCEIEPYSLGVFLGDGHFVDRVCFKINERYSEMKRKDKTYFHRKNYRQIGITTKDFEIIEEVAKHYQIIGTHKKQGTLAKTFTFSVKDKFSQLLIKYKLNGKRSGHKFIPKEALLSDIEYRKKLLAGLIDTDGYYYNGRYDLTTKSKQLAEDILFLVYGLGGRGNIRKVKKSIKKINFMGTYYSVGFYFGKMELPLKVERKKRDIPCCYVSSNRVAIDSVPAKEKYVVYGFTLDSPSGLYITDNFMVTHNCGKSWSAISLAEIVDPTFSVDRVVFRFTELLELLVEKDKNGVPILKKGNCIVFDECGISMSSDNWWSFFNRVASQILQTFRYRNLCVLFTTPQFGFIAKKSRQMIHCVFESTNKINKEKGLCYFKPKGLQTNPLRGKIYTKYYKVRLDGKTYKIIRYAAPKPSPELLRAYEIKQKAVKEALQYNLLNDVRRYEKSLILKEDNKEKTKLTETQKEVYMLKQQGLMNKEIAYKLGVSERAIYDTIVRIKKKGYDVGGKKIEVHKTEV